MGNESSIVFSGIAPHPPIMVPEVGRDAIAAVRSSIEAMVELTQRVIDSGAETVILITPHAPLDASAFVAYCSPILYGDFANFRAPQTQIQFPLDAALLEAISNIADQENFEVMNLEDYSLDHGSSVPLYFLDRYGWKGKVVALGYSFLSDEDHTRFGGCIKSAVDRLDHPVAFIASGDLSHRLKPDAPAGFNPAAHRFDDEVVNAIEKNVAGRIVDIPPDVRRIAGECGYRSMLVALGATRDVAPAGEVLSYEAPFGVGYLVAQLTNAGPTNGQGTAFVAGSAHDSDPAVELPTLARNAVEKFVRSGKQLAVPIKSAPLLAARAACFVSIKTADGNLRGCIGTVEPTRQTLAEEIIANAISAATRDPRFDPVSVGELAGLRYSVDVLAASELTTLAELDPAIYGVIVEDESGYRRGLLLPAIAGIDSTAQQVEIASRKAGIGPGEPVKLSRFRVDRFRERD